MLLAIQARNQYLVRQRLITATSYSRPTAMQYVRSNSSSHFVVLCYDFHALISLKIKNILVPDEFN